MHETTMYQIMIDYLNIAGISLVAAFLIVVGLRWIFPETVSLKARFIFGVMFILMGILLIARFLFWLH